MLISMWDPEIPLLLNKPEALRNLLLTFYTVKLIPTCLNAGNRRLRTIYLLEPTFDAFAL